MLKNAIFWQKNSNSRQNLGPGTKSDFIFELSVVDLGGTPNFLGFYKAFLKSDLWSLSESSMTHNLIFCDLWSLKKNTYTLTFPALHEYQKKLIGFIEKKWV